MKILFFSHGKRANGGAERCLLDLVKGLKQARESWEIYVVFPAKDELWEMTLLVGICFHSPAVVACASEKT